MEIATYAGYKQAKRVWEDLGLQNLGQYYNRYVQSDALLLTEAFESFRNKSLEIYKVDPAHFLSAPRLVWKACSKKKEVELELLTDADVLLMLEKGIRYAKTNNKYMTIWRQNCHTSCTKIQQSIWMGNVTKVTRR